MGKQMCWQGGQETSLSGGDERLKNLEQVVLKTQNLSNQLHLLVNCPPAQGCPSIPNLNAEAYMTDLLQGKILEAIRRNETLRNITVAECIEHDGMIWFSGNHYVPADSVSNGSKFPVQFRVRFQHRTGPLQRILPYKNPDRCDRASFTTKHPAFQPHNFRSK